jgi:pilus assembly protein CpaE
MTSLNPQEDSAGHNGGAPVIQVPHINIAAFCADPGSAGLMQAAAADRRMSRASLTIATGGAAAAVEAFRDTPTPPVLIVECPGAPGDVLSELARLAEVCQPESRVIVIGRVNDIGLYRELIHQGVSEYLIAPVTPVRVIEAIAALFRNPKAPPLGKTVAFIGARGGAGSSTLAHNLAWSLARQHDANTVIADLDLAFGTAGLNFNEDIANGILDALNQPGRVDGVLLDRLLVNAGDRLSLLAGPGGVDRDYELDPQSVDAVLSALRQSVPFTVADLPKQWSPWVKAALLHADHVVITAVPDLASLRNARGLAELLKGARPNDPPPYLVLNQTGMPRRPEIKPDDFAKAAGLTVAAIIAHEPQTFSAALNRGKMIFEVAPKSKAAEALTKLSHQIAGAAKDAKKPAGKAKSLFSFLRRA